MRLHENENNEVDELQRLRARRQGTSRSRRSASSLSKTTSSRTEFKTVPKQAKAIDHTYDEDYYEEEDYDYDDYREESVRSGLEVPFENENHSRVISTGSYQSKQKNTADSKNPRASASKRKTSQIPADKGENSFGGYSSKNSSHSRKPYRKRKKPKWPAILLCLLAVICVYGGWTFLHRATGYWNIAVFGVDSRDGNTKNALADVQVICSINQETGDIKLVSVYRDTYLKIDSKGTYHKINEAYFKGGHKQAVSALEENLDLKINDYATFNWKAVAQAINVLGGIDIDITQPEFKYINAFITETVNSTGIGSTQLTSAGPNHLDGVQAVAYCRLRLMDTDFQRTERQRKVISLALEKAKQADLATRTNLVKAILPQISTSVGIDDVLPLAKNISKYHIGETSGFPFAQKTKKMGKMDCVIPVTLESNVVTLHQFLYGEDALYSPSSAVKKISDHIAEESGFYEGGKAAPTSSGSGKSDSKNQSSGNSKNNTPAPAQTAAETTAAESSDAEEITDKTSEANNETEAEESTAAVIEKLEESKTEKETSNASEGGPGTVKPKETEKAQETTADNSSKGPGVQETSDSSNSKPDEMPGNAKPIGPGV